MNSTFALLQCVNIIYHKLKIYNHQINKENQIILTALERFFSNLIQTQISSKRKRKGRRKKGKETSLSICLSTHTWTIPHFLEIATTMKLWLCGFSLYSFKELLWGFLSSASFPPKTRIDSILSQFPYLNKKSNFIY